jgi:AbiV family abortive infection protein
MADVEVEVVDPWIARRWWLALMSNAVGLVEDAVALSLRGSFGRAQALLVLAVEEHKRARSLYGVVANEWSKLLDSDELLDVPREVVEMGQLPTSRLHVAQRYREGMAQFWDPEDEDGYRCISGEGDRDAAEIKKQAGFHVDRHGNLVTSPMDIPVGDIPWVLTQVARGIEKHLHEDRWRHRFAHPDRPLGAVDELCTEIHPFAWPDEFGAALG